MLLVPYQGKKGGYVINSIEKRVNTLLPTGIVTKIAYVDTKLSTFFRVKDVNKFKHNHDLIYQGRCPEIDCNHHYLEETGHRISEKVLDHLFKHSVESGHPGLDMNNFKIIEKGCKTILENGKLLKRF